MEVSCLPGNIPDRILVHATDLATGGKVRVKDLELGNGIKAVTPLEETVVQAMAPSVAAEPEPTATEQPAGDEPEVIKEKKEEA